MSINFHQKFYPALFFCEETPMVTWLMMGIHVPMQRKTTAAAKTEERTKKYVRSERGAVMI